jgi:glycerol-3-phosphate dehydrogenase subunit C
VFGAVRRLPPASGQTLITDCLSCRMQLKHVFSRQVFHPLELLIAV